MYAPVCTRFRTYDVKMPPRAAAYRDSFCIGRSWSNGRRRRRRSPMEIEELDMEF